MGGGLMDFVQRFQNIQLQRDTSDELIKVPESDLGPLPYVPVHRLKSSLAVPIPILKLMCDASFPLPL